jgi:hypothetical protein
MEALHAREDERHGSAEGRVLGSEQARGGNTPLLTNVGSGIGRYARRKVRRSRKRTELIVAARCCFQASGCSWSSTYLSIRFRGTRSA